MADVSKIKLPNGTTYNIKDTASGYTKNTGTITSVKTTAGAHTTIDVSSGAATFNVPTKTSHLTNDSGFLTSVSNDSHYHSPDTIYIPTNYARTGSLDLFSATKIGSYMSNKSFAIPPEAITIEYSTDGGSTWQDYGATDLHKRGLFAETRNNCNTFLGKATTKEANSLNNQLRITISRINLGRYTAINSFYTWMTTNGNTVYCKLERSLNSSPTAFETVFTDFKLAGWSGHNIRYFPTMSLGGGNDNQPYAIRLTVWQTAITTNYPSANLYDIRFYGPDTYSASAPYYKVQTNELYTWDNALNAIFPAGITATSFSGNLTGNVTGNVSGTATNVTGTVAIANGGTGQTTAANAINALLNGLPTWTADPTDTTYFIRQDTGGSATYGKVQATTLWNYISGKLPAWSKASTKPSYNFSEIGSTPTTLSGYGITDAKIVSGVITLGSNTITPLTSSSTLNAAKLSGAIPSAITATTQASTDNSTKIATTAYVTTAIANLPEPMVFKGSVGTGGTVTSLPTAATSNEGHTYKVITALSSPSAKVGDTVISNGSEWIVIPSGDEPSGTVISVGVSNATNGGLTVSGSPITSSGTVTIGHSNVLSSAQTTQAVYPIKIDKNGHISAYGSAITSLPASDVSAWAKASSKPSYTASEVGAVPTTRTVNNKALTANISLDASDVGAQATLVSGSNIKTINDISLLGSGDVWEALFNIVHPIYSFFETTDATFDPNTATGWYGTWELETEGLVHIGAGSTYTVGNTGGNKDAIIPYHKHTLTNPTVTVPKHTHGFTQPKVTGGAVSDGITGGSHEHKIRTHSNTGSGSSYPFEVTSAASKYVDNGDRIAAATHTHDLPSHTHTVSGGAVSEKAAFDATVSGGSIGYAGTSGNTTDANMQPYVVVNRWYRTA